MLWYAHQFTRSGAAYHITGAGSVRAELDIDALRRAFRRVVARQEALRTTFAVVDEKPAVRLLDVDELARREDEWLPIEDVSDHGDAELQKKLTELSGRPFDLEKGPLFRVHVLSRSTTEHVFLLVFHHIIADFWSTAVFLDDFKTAYTAELEGRGIALPAPRSCYADFARWQHTMLASDEGERHWAYWRDQLAGTLPVLDLPTDFTRPPVQSYRGGVRHFYLDPALTRAIVALSESRGASLYTTLLAAFQVLLARFSGQHDIVVGTPAAGRTRPGLQELVGYFVNLVPMRGDLSGNPPFDEFLGRVRRTVAEGLEHQDFPFSLLARRLQGNPDPSRPPLFQAMFAHQKIQPLDEQGLAPFALGIPGARLNLYGLAVDSIAFERQTALFDLTMMTAREGDRLCVALEYSTDLFTASTIDRMAASFRNLLEAIVADPGRRIADLPLLSESERHQSLGEWAALPEITHGDLAIHHRFERQVDKSPDAIALVFGEESLTYRELNLLSNSLAHRLIELGVTPETVVGLCLDPWPSRVIGLLSVLKAGGAYVPLDPDHPAERLVAMLRDSRASLLLTEDNLRDRLAASAVPVVTLDAPRKSLGEEDPGNPSVCVNPENLAYVVFTSGTTGRPKGVMVSHGALLAVAAAWESAYDLRRPPLRHLQAAGFSFDVFTGDWVRALTTGGTLVACPRPVLLDPAALADLIRRERIECLELVPALADALAAHLERQGEDLDGVRLLAVGSDTVRWRLYRRLCRLVGPGGRVVNSYGLTETTIDSTYFGGPLDELRGRRPGPDRPPVARHACLRSGRAPRTGPLRRSRRLVYRRIRRGAGLRGRPASDGRAVRARPTRCAGFADVRDRGPGAMERGRRAGVARSAGRPGKGPWLPRRACRSRDGAHATPWRGRIGGRAPGGFQRRDAARRLCRACDRPGPRDVGPASMAEGPTARADDPILVCLTRRDAPLAKRQGRSIGPPLGYRGSLRTADRIRSPAYHRGGDPRRDRGGTRGAEPRRHSR